MAGTMLIVDIDIKLRIDVFGDHSDELCAELGGMNLRHFTKLGGITR